MRGWLRTVKGKERRVAYFNITSGYSSGVSNKNCKKAVGRATASSSAQTRYFLNTSEAGYHWARCSPQGLVSENTCTDVRGQSVTEHPLCYITASLAGRRTRVTSRHDRERGQVCSQPGVLNQCIANCHHAYIPVRRDTNAWNSCRIIQ
jgi:hypothetical protein